MSRTILLADDSLAIQRVVGLTFEESPFDVVAVGSGDEALYELERLAPDIVLADVHMPGANGYEVARRVKERDAATPVLLLVGTFEPFDEEECRESGADGHLLKPFESGELRRRVEALVGEVSAVPPAGQSAAEETAASAAERAEAIDTSSGPTSAPDGDTWPVVPPDVSAQPPASTDTSRLDAETIDRIARRVVEMISVQAVREIAAEVVPRIAEQAVARRIEELERDVE